MTPSPLPLRVLVVDDEEPARLVLRELLAAHADVAIVGEARTGVEALQQAQRTHPDVVLLDVQMPGLDGFETLELLDPDVAVVFVTAYDDYALRAFDVNAVDYLLKPFPPERMATALARARERVGRRRVPDAASLAVAARPTGTWATRLVVRDGPRVDLVPVEALLYARGQADYVELVTEGRSFLKQQTLQALEASLDPSVFVRIHRSYLVNVTRIARLEPRGADGKAAVLVDGTELPVSRSGLARVNEVLRGP